MLGAAMIIGAIFAFIIGAFSIGISSYVADYVLSSRLLEQNPSLPPEVFTHSFIENVMLFIGVSALVVGMVNLLFAYGLLKGAEWGRLTVIIFSAIGLILSAILTAAGGILFIALLLVNGAIIYYLTRPNVVDYFHVQK
ncbi:MAG: hypothetical protein M1503_07250 [Thaumarchaeota archaeon]|nr:hypothetical protein [Nitrososphaerota archaeon]MCL5318037.1 hypothetical protein [Nitrososphaerota archaeon]